MVSLKYDWILDETQILIVPLTSKDKGPLDFIFTYVDKKVELIIMTPFYEESYMSPVLSTPFILNKFNELLKKFKFEFLIFYENLYP